MRSGRDLRFCGGRRPKPRWQVYDFVQTAGQTVLKGVSTDNHFFAVRAVGKNGARSIAVVTEMERRPPPGPREEVDGVGAGTRRGKRVPRFARSDKFAACRADGIKDRSPRTATGDEDDVLWRIIARLFLRPEVHYEDFFEAVA